MQHFHHNISITIDALWYSKHFSKLKKADVVENSIIAVSGGDGANLADDQKKKLAERDEILTKLLNVSTGQKKSHIISRYHFHDALITEKEAEKVIDSSNVKTDEEVSDNHREEMEPSVPTCAKNSRTQNEGAFDTKEKSEQKLNKKRAHAKEKKQDTKENNDVTRIQSPPRKRAKLSAQKSVVPKKEQLLIVKIFD